MYLSTPAISTTHFSSDHTCPCPQRTPAVEHVVPYFTSTTEVLWQREEVSIEKRLRKKYLSTNTGNGMGHWAGVVTGRRSITFAKEAFLESGDVLVCRQWIQWLLSATVMSCHVIGSRREGGQKQWRRLSPPILHRMILSDPHLSFPPFASVLPANFAMCNTTVINPSSPLKPKYCWSDSIACVSQGSARKWETLKAQENHYHFPCITDHQEVSSLCFAGFLAGMPVLPLRGKGVAAPSVGHPLLRAVWVAVTCKEVKILILFSTINQQKYFQAARTYWKTTHLDSWNAENSSQDQTLNITV